MVHAKTLDGLEQRTLVTETYLVKISVPQHWIQDSKTHFTKRALDGLKRGASRRGLYAWVSSHPPATDTCPKI